MRASSSTDSAEIRPPAQRLLLPVVLRAGALGDERPSLVEPQALRLVAASLARCSRRRPPSKVCSCSSRRRSPWRSFCSVTQPRISARHWSECRRQSRLIGGGPRCQAGWAPMIAPAQCLGLGEALGWSAPSASLAAAPPWLVHLWARQNRSVLVTAPAAGGRRPAVHGSRCAVGSRRAVGGFFFVQCSRRRFLLRLGNPCFLSGYFVVLLFLRLLLISSVSSSAGNHSLLLFPRRLVPFYVFLICCFLLFLFFASCSSSSWASS